MRVICVAALVQLAAAGVLAQEAPVPNLVPGAGGARSGPAQLVMAQELFALGMARQDALSVLAAARLAQGVTLTEASARLPETTGGKAGEPAGTPPAASDMLKAAEALMGEDELLLGLLDDATASGGQDLPGGAVRSAGTVAPGAEDAWKIAFFGQSYAEVGVAGDGRAPLVLRVTDAAGNTVCIAPTGPFGLCGFVPAENGHFTVIVRNAGSAASGYDLLTN